MANPQDRSFGMDENGCDDEELARAAATASNHSPSTKKMMTTSKDFQYHSSTTGSAPRDGSSSRGGDSRDTNPNQADDSSERVVTPRSYSPFHEMWQRYSGNFTPPSLQTLEEGKQLLQKRFASFFDDACTHSACQYPETDLPHDETTPLRSKSKPSIVSPDNDSPSRLDMRRSLINTTPSADKSENHFLNGDEQRNAMGRGGLSGTVPGGVSARRGSLPLPANTLRQSPIAAAQDTANEIEVNSGNEVKVIEPSPSAGGMPPLPPDQSSTPKSNKKVPMELLEVRSEDAYELERSISELTMRSSYGGGESLANIPDNRRMAYYAVGKNHRQSGRGGNRRCYFSGKLILGGAPFYAGAVQQGLRTLVVFCLPSALNLPDRETLLKHNGQTPARRNSRSSSLADSSNESKSGILKETSRATRSINSRSLASRSGDKTGRASRRGLRGLIQNNNSMNNDGANSIASRSRMSSLDDLSLSIDGDLDPNWGLDRDLLLKVLPEADAKLLESMSNLFPEQFETLPVQVRDPTRWKLYVKFCFFSGLPIAEGEMHYKVLDELAEQVYGEEIVLSHDVMEAVNGDVSAEILQLPNQKVFRYLRKHYAQQCSKLDDRVFRRSAWIRVAPEV